MLEKSTRSLTSSSEQGGDDAVAFNRSGPLPIARLRAPSVILAIALQIMPVCRVATIAPASAPTAFAVVFRCMALLGTGLGAVHAVSGASAVISGVVKYPFSHLNPITNNAVGGVGQLFAYRIIVTGGLNDTNADYYNASPLPPGLTINTNVGAPGFIIGTTTVAGVYFPVQLTAGNTIYDSTGTGAPIHLNITITITNSSGGTKPSFTTQPHDTTVTNGGSATFTSVASGSPTPTYQWRRYGTNLSGLTSANYTIGSATTNDAAPYTVVASNVSGSATSQVAMLTVLVPAGISTQPQTKTALEGTSATFAVVAGGIPPPSFQWRKNSTNISGAMASGYTISPVTLPDAADYTVLVSNSVNTVTSQLARLNVVQPPQITGVGLSGNSMTMGFTRGAGAAYDVLASPVIPTTNWLTLTNFPVQPSTSTVTLTNSTTNGTNWFYKVRMTIP